MLQKLELEELRPEKIGVFEICSQLLELKLKKYPVK